MIPLLSNKFLMPEHFWDTTVPLRIFSVLWDKKDQQKTSDGITWHPLFIQNPFPTRNVLKHRRVPLRIFSALWDWNFPTGTRETPLLCIQFLDAPIYLNHWKFSAKSSALWDKNNRENRDTLIIQKILIQEYFWNTERFAHDDFWRCEKKKFEKSWYLIIQKNFDTRTILKHRRVRPRWFSAIWDKKKSTKLWHLILQNFSIPEHFWDTRDPYEMFRYCETKKINKIVIPLLSKTVLIPERFWNTEGFAHDVFLRFGTKNFRRNNVTPPFYP